MLIWLVCLDDTLLPTKEIIPKPEEKEAWISEKGLSLAYQNFFRKISFYQQMQNAVSTGFKHRLFFYHYKSLSPDTLSNFIKTFQQNSIFFRMSPVINLIGSDKKKFRMEIKKKLHFKHNIKTFHETGGSSDSSGSSSSASTPKRTASLACSRRGSIGATSLDRKASIGISPLATITLLASTGRKLSALGIDSPTLGKSRISKIALDNIDLPDIHDYFVIDSDLEITQPITKLQFSELNPSWAAVNPRFQYLASLLIQIAEKFQFMLPKTFK